MKYLNNKHVYAKCPYDEAMRRTGRKPISVRWVDVNKGDDQNPRYRPRLAARQMKAHDRSGMCYFVPTPPLQALRTVISMAATTMPGWRPVCGPKPSERVQISFVDISRAYFNAKADLESNTCVQLPEEDGDHGTHVAKLP